MKRHIGKMANTDQRLVVAFMQIPGRETHALVIPSDTLPGRYHDAVMEILESAEGQAEECLANVLSRRLLPDTGKPVLTALHEGNMLVPVPVANILMLPMPNMPFPLTTILEGMGRVVPKTLAPDTGLASPQPAVEKYNQHLANQRIDGVENRRAVAQNLLIEADMLQNAANQKRAQAYATAPEMAPKAAAEAPAPEISALVAKTVKAPAKPRAKAKKTASE